MKNFLKITNKLPLVLSAYFIALSLLSLSSCRPDPLEIEIPDLEQRVVVFSQIIPNQIMTVVLTKTIGALDFSENEGDSFTQNLLDDLLVENAEVTISYRDIVDTLSQESPGVYVSIQTPQYINEEYKLRVETVEGEILTSSSSMLPLVEFVEVNPIIERTEKDTTISVKYKIFDLAERNWYMLNFYTSNTSQDTSSELGLNSFFSEGSSVLKRTELISDILFLDNVFEGEVILDNVNQNDSLVVTLSNINEEYYQYLELRQKAGNLFTELTKEPISSPTNIEGGLGFFNTHFPDIKFFDLNEY